MEDEVLPKAAASKLRKAAAHPGWVGRDLKAAAVCGVLPRLKEAASTKFYKRPKSRDIC